MFYLDLDWIIFESRNSTNEVPFMVPTKVPNEVPTKVHNEVPTKQGSYQS